MTSQIYSTQNEALMAKWKSKYAASEHSFVRDGIVSPMVWFSLPPKKERILFLLKEAYSKEDAHYDWDEAKWLAHEKCMEHCTKNCTECSITGNTFNPLAEWIYGISLVETGDPIEHDKWLGARKKGTQKNYSDIRDNLLSRAAVVNIKKSGGVSSSEKDDIYYYVASDKEFLIEQIQLIQPTLIICGGTYGMLRCLFPELEKLPNLEDGSTRLGTIKVIASCHPNARTNNKHKFDTVLKNYLSIIEDNRSTN